MIFKLTIYDSTRWSINTFWGYRHPDINIQLLDAFYSLLVKNQDIANLSEISSVQQRVGVALLDERTSVVYRVFAGQETSRLSSVVIALFFERDAIETADVPALLDCSKSLEQYIQRHEGSGGILACPLKEPPFLTVDVDLPQRQSGIPIPSLTPFTKDQMAAFDFKSDRYISSEPSEYLNSLLHSFAHQKGQLVATAHIREDKTAEIHSLWMPQIKHMESPPAQMLRLEVSVDRRDLKPKSPRRIKKLILGAVISIFVLGAVLFMNRPEPSTLPSSTYKPDHTVIQLATINVFDLGKKNQTNMLSQGEALLSVLLNRPSVTNDLQWLFEHGNNEGKAYALAGLKHLMEKNCVARPPVESRPTESPVLVATNVISGKASIVQTVTNKVSEYER